MIELSTRRLSLCGWAAVAAVVLSSCSSSDAPTAPPPEDPQKLLWAVVLDHHAITLATSGTQSSIQLAPVALNANGDKLSGAPITYSLSDSEVVTVDGKGLLTAHQPAVGVQLIASTSLGNVTKKDTALVNVVDAASTPVLQGFTVSLASGAVALPASDAFGFFGTDQATVTATDADANPIDGLPAYFTSSDPTTLAVDHATGAVHAIRPGEAKLKATTTAFGITKSDSVTIKVLPPQFAAVGAFATTPFGSPSQVLVFQPADLTVSAGASIFFVNQSATMSIDIVFDDPTDVAESSLFPMGSGNITAFRTDTIHGDPGYRFRAFPKAGTYTYHSTLFKTNGRIVVQ